MSHPSLKQKTCLALIGGSGLYSLPGVQNVTEEVVSTPFGDPSDKIVKASIDGKPILFLPRHGKGHRLLPSEVNSRANVFALKKLGATHIVSVSAVGSLTERLAPGCAVMPTQILDRTLGLRKRTFFGEGLVGHVSFADPFCPRLQEWIQEAGRQSGVSVSLGGTYVCIEGPRFGTRAESHGFRSHGADVVGMTAMPEAVLAREAEIAYATLAFVTDYDCWKEDSEAVTVDAVLAVLQKNVLAAQKIVLALHKVLPPVTENPVFCAAEHALMTDLKLIPSQTREKLDLLYGKYWR